MAGKMEAFVTLATNDVYGVAALVWANSLRKHETTRQIVAIVTPEVSMGVKKNLEGICDLVHVVNILDTEDFVHLALAKRPELGVTLTKINAWNLTQYSKCVFMDADTLVLDNIDELFEREELSATPDIGWPDCFNSGVFVFSPSNATFTELLQLAEREGSFDGGDQGLLNTYFSSWSTSEASRRLPFVYNMASNVTYSYLPAFKRFGRDVKVCHFLGPLKPWHHQFDVESGKVKPVDQNYHVTAFLQGWWNIYRSLVLPNLDGEQNEVSSHEVTSFPPEAETLKAEAPGIPVGSEEHRRAFESGNLDVGGRDSFDSILEHLKKSVNVGSEQVPYY